MHCNACIRSQVAVQPRMYQNCRDPEIILREVHHQDVAARRMALFFTWTEAGENCQEVRLAGSPGPPSAAHGPSR